MTGDSPKSEVARGAVCTQRRGWLRCHLPSQSPATSLGTKQFFSSGFLNALNKKAEASQDTSKLNKTLQRVLN